MAEDLSILLEKIENIKRSKQVEVFESERIGKDRDHMILEVVVSPVKNELGELVGVSTIARDLTARRVAEKTLRDKEILQRLIVAQEDERSRISRDMHDEVGQQLTALRFAVEQAKVQLAAGNEPPDLSKIDRLAATIDASLDFLAWELRPAMLDGTGITAAINNYAKQWSEHAGIRSEVLSNLKKKRLPERTETNLYRIMQEALNNTHKHANATSIDIILEHKGDAVLMIITDNGRGFNLNNKKLLTNGLGLTGMRERAALLGGSVEIESSATGGTAIHVRIPDTPRKKRKALQANADTDWH
jgi:signal transduction histidine kinase